MSNYIQEFYMDVITYPCSNPDRGQTSLAKKGPRGFFCWWRGEYWGNDPQWILHMCFGHESMINALTNWCQCWYQALHGSLQSDLSYYPKLGAHLYPVLYWAVFTHKSPLPAVPLAVLWCFVCYSMWMLYPVALNSEWRKTQKQYFVDRIRA